VERPRRRGWYRAGSLPWRPSQVATLLFLDDAQRAAVVNHLVLAFALELDAQPQLVLRVGVAQRILVGDRAVSYSSYSAWSKVFMPRRVERDITSLILATSPLKIRSWMSGELSMISIAAMRPEPASRGISRCDTSAPYVQRQIHEQLVAALVGEERN